MGILALQGDYEAHGQMLERIGVEYLFVRRPQHLSIIQGMIIPGGESTALLKFLADDNFLSAIQTFSQQGKYLFGTCAGAILLARQVMNPTQISLGLIDVDIQRNAYGRQLASKVDMGWYCVEDKPMEMIFIRAPRISHCGKEIKVIATYHNDPVCVEQNRCLIATFHPELTQDETLHRYFAKQAYS